MMFSSLLLTLALNGLLPFTQSQPLDRLRQRSPDVFLSELRSLTLRHLEWHRSRQAFLEDQIEWFERMAREAPDLAARARQHIAESREHVEFGKKYEQELQSWERQWKQNPAWVPDDDAFARLRSLRPAPDPAAVARVERFLEQRAARKHGVNLAPPPREKK